MTYKKYNTELCDNEMTFQDCELAILRHAVDDSETMQGQKIANSEDVKKIISIVEDFLMKKKLVCYGGTAINAILPKFAQFYNKDVEVPDYDFFSNRALEHAKELADIYFEAGYTDVEAKSGVHPGTYKVFVNFIPVADITYLEKEIFDAIQKESIKRSGIFYAPPNYLRMGMYLELSRPQGDVSRWEKVLKRLNLLNKYYPLKSSIKCETIDFQRSMETNEKESSKIYFIVRDALIDQGVVFFGGYASSLYSRYMPKSQKKLIMQIPDFDVLSEEPERTANIVGEQLQEYGYKNIKIIKHDAIGEIIPERYEVRIGKDTLAFLYKPIACHSYNTITINDKEINVATIDTMLSFYLAFIYADKPFPYFNKDRILCMAEFLFNVEQENRLEQRGLLKRFSLECYGKQPTLESIRAEKAEKFKELSGKRGMREFEEWFLRYNPNAIKEKEEKEHKLKKTSKNVEKKTQTRKRRKNKTNFLNIF
jgi:Poly(A) polymerase catalytic subunit